MTEGERQNYSRLEPGVDIDMELAGTDLHIPRQDWDDPAMQELAGFIVRAEELQQDLFKAATQAGCEKSPPFLDGAHSLGQRYLTAEQLLRVILAMLKEGLGVWETRQEPGSRNFDYLEEKLTTALEPYGMTIIPRSKAP